jgi:hypothetical protein
MATELDLAINKACELIEDISFINLPKMLFTFSIDLSK